MLNGTSLLAGGGLYNRTANFLRPTLSVSADGGTIRNATGSTYLSNIACTIQKVTGSERDYWERRGIQEAHKLFSGTNLAACQQDDRVTDDAGIQYRVADNVKDEGGRGRVFRVVLERLI
jgi:hypothetical protein